MPWARLMLKIPAASAAPVPPAQTRACARPCATALRGEHDRCVRCRAGRQRGVLRLGDRDRCVHHLDAVGHGAELLLRPEQQHPCSCGGRDRGAGGHLARPHVGAVAVDRDHRPSFLTAHAVSRGRSPCSHCPSRSGRARDRDRDRGVGSRSHGPHRCRRPGTRGAACAGCGTAGTRSRQACRSCAVRVAAPCGRAIAFSWVPPSASKPTSPRLIHSSFSSRSFAQRGSGSLSWW